MEGRATTHFAPSADNTSVGSTQRADTPIRVRTLEQLADAGILAERACQRRNRVWIHEGIVQVLDQYAEQLRR